MESIININSETFSYHTFIYACQYGKLEIRNFLEDIGITVK